MPILWQYAYEGKAVCNLQGMATMYKPCETIIISREHKSYFFFFINLFIGGSSILHFRGSKTVLHFPFLLTK